MLACASVLAVDCLTLYADQNVTPSETTIQLHVQPMAASKPALRHQLLPELREMTPGNPISNYLRCVLSQDTSAERDTLGRSALKMVDQAARMDKPDWQILLKMRTDGIGLLLPDVQKMRFLASAMQARFHEEVALHHFDDAINTAKTMFAMSRHMGQHPTLIGDLVAIAMAMVTIGPLEEMLEQPGCPNLYWALTNLPSPFVSLENGMQGERTLILAELRDLDETAPMTGQQIAKLVAYIDKLRELEGNGRNTPKRTQAWLDARAKDSAKLDAARKRLVDVGLSEERLLRFPAEQIILLDEKLNYEVRRDEMMKLMGLPAWQCASLLEPPIKQKQEDGLFTFLVPAMHKVRQAQTRLDLRIVLLRHVEALRMYAAEHNGQLPKKLSDVPVPLPVDPFTGTPIRYSLDGATAHLRGGLPDGVQTDRADLHVHFVVTLQK